MTTLESLLLFVGIPVALAIVVFAFVSASSWTRAGRTSADFAGDPFLVASDPALPDPARLPSELARPGTVAGGGVSAGW